jgi:hypothetical protein
MQLKLDEADRDYCDVVAANIRLMLFLKEQGLEPPTYRKMVRRFPLDHHKPIVPAYAHRKMRPAKIKRQKVLA